MTNEPKFTKGPWCVGADLTGICVDWRDEHGNSSRDCFTRNGWAKTVAKITHASFADPIEHLANARLIAAAPDLLEACQRALRHAQNIGIDSEGSSYVNTLRAAIAKALGQ